MRAVWTLLLVFIPTLGVAAPVPSSGGPTVQAVELAKGDVPNTRFPRLMTADGQAYLFRDVAKLTGANLGTTRPCRIGRIDRESGKETLFAEVELQSSIEFRLRCFGEVLEHSHIDGQKALCYTFYDTNTGKVLSEVKLPAGGDKAPFGFWTATYTRGAEVCFTTDRAGGLNRVDLKKPDIGTPLKDLVTLPTYGKAPVEWGGARNPQANSDDTQLVWTKGARLNSDTDQEVEAVNVVVYDLKANKAKGVHPLYDHTAEPHLRIRALKCSPVGSLAAFTVADYSSNPKGAREHTVTRQSLRLMDLDTGKEAFRTTFDGPVKDFWFDPAGRFVMAVTEVKKAKPENDSDFETQLWFCDTATHKQTAHRVADFHTWYVLSSGDGTLVHLLEETGNDSRDPEVKMFRVTYPPPEKKSK
jgi:hypothetical protein